MAAKTVARTKSSRAKKRKSGARAKSSRRKATRARAGTRTRRWSQRVTEKSDALDLEGGVFRQKDPQRIAASLKRSAERSRRRKSDPYRPAMSMLTFYVNRAGKTLPAAQKKTLQQAQEEFGRQFGRA